MKIIKAKTILLCVVWWCWNSKSELNYKAVAISFNMNVECVLKEKQRGHFAWFEYLKSDYSVIVAIF